ncbi:MAG: acyl-CoA desaturase, partial [Saprospiraceae bacterium]|nr:acyl-CoA desaturase [Pyrinomonadaceae bacterium]
MQNVVEIQADSKRINWSTVIGVTVFHSLAVAALFMFSWQNLIAALILWWFAGSLGVGIGYHRLLTHRG